MHKVTRAMLEAGFSRDNFWLNPVAYPKWKLALLRAVGRKIPDLKVHNPSFDQVEIQLVSWCNRECSFCPSGTFSVPKLMMKSDVVERIVSQLEHVRFTGTIGLHLMSEPLLHTNFSTIVAEFRKRLPRVYIRAETNGDVLDKSNMAPIQDYFGAGLNELLINCYDSVEQRERRNALLLQLASTNSSLWYWNDRQRLPLTRRNKWQVIRLRDHFDEGGYSLRNWAGHVELQNDICGESDFPLPISCPRPFERFHVNYRGQILLCNNDWKFETVIGDLMEQELREVWNAPLLTDHYRPRLLECNRDMTLCRTCDTGVPFGYKQPQLTPARIRGTSRWSRIVRRLKGGTGGQAGEAGSGNI